MSNEYAAHTATEGGTMSIVDVMGAHLVDVPPNATVRAAARTMTDHGVGSVAVCQDCKLVGMLTERNVLELVAREADLDGLEVREVMRTRLVTAEPHDGILDVARLMSQHRVRHVPVVQGEHALGIIGVRDVVDALAEGLCRTDDPALKETVHELLAG